MGGAWAGRGRGRGRGGAPAVATSGARRLSTFPPRSPQVVAGDVTDAASVAAALKGATAAIFAASAPRGGSVNAVDDDGVGVVAAAAAAANLSSVVLISSALVSPWNRWHPIRLLLNNMRGPFSGQHIMDAKWAGEKKLRASGVPYTVIRPGGLTDGPAGEAALVVAQGDTSAGRVARADVAAVAVAATRAPAAVRVTLELASDAKAAAGAGPAPGAVFEGLAKDA